MGTAAGVIAVIMLAVLCEFLTKLFKPLLPQTKYPFALVISMIFGVALTVLTSFDVLSELGFIVVSPIAGQIITGLIISGGSSGVHELIAKLRASRIEHNNVA